MNKSSEELLSDEELMFLVLKDKELFTHIVGRYEKKLFRYVNRITNVSKEDIEDILQDVFVKAYVNMNSFNNSLKLSSWLYRITYNEVVSRHRKTKVRPEGNYINLEEGDIMQFCDIFCIEKDIHVSQIKGFIEEALGCIDFKYRQVLMLKFLEDRSYLEISDIIKKPPGTVATLIHRGKVKLKKEISKNIKYYE